MFFRKSLTRQRKKQSVEIQQEAYEEISVLQTLPAEILYHIFSYTGSAIPNLAKTCTLFNSFLSQNKNLWAFFCEHQNRLYRRLAKLNIRWNRDRESLKEFFVRAKMVVGQKYEEKSKKKSKKSFHEQLDYLLKIDFIKTYPNIKGGGQRKIAKAIYLSREEDVCNLLQHSSSVRKYLNKGAATPGGLILNLEDLYRFAYRENEIKCFMHLLKYGWPREEEKLYPIKLNGRIHLLEDIFLQSIVDGKIAFTKLLFDNKYSYDIIITYPYCSQMSMIENNSIFSKHITALNQAKKMNRTQGIDLYLNHYLNIYSLEGIKFLLAASIQVNKSKDN